MTDPARPLDAIVDPVDSTIPRFPPQSRYVGVSITTRPGSDGHVIAYLRRRFVPSPERFAAVTEYTVVQGDRLDRIAAGQLGDAELFWRLCDANGAVRPDELTATIGRRLRITLPEGLPGASDD